MTPALADLIAGLEARGVTLTEKQGGIAIRPASAVTPTEREVLTTMKAEVLAVLRARQARADHGGVDWTTVPLYSLDKVLEIIVPFYDVPLVIAPGCRIAAELRARDARPGRVWCTCELLDVLLTGMRPEDARKLAEAKLALGATLTGRFDREA